MINPNELKEGNSVRFLINNLNLGQPIMEEARITKIDNSMPSFNEPELRTITLDNGLQISSKNVYAAPLSREYLSQFSIDIKEEKNYIFYSIQPPTSNGNIKAFLVIEVQGYFFFSPGNLPLSKHNFQNIYKDISGMSI